MIVRRGGDREKQAEKTNSEAERMHGKDEEAKTK
jgi:hypothetical protein